MSSPATTPILEVRELTKTFTSRNGIGKSETVSAVRGVSFDVHRGQTLALVGESGCGKTTVGQSVARLIEPTAGTVVFDGQDITGLNNTALRRVRQQMQFVFQDPFSSLNPRLTIADILSEPLRAQGTYQRRPATKRMLELADRVGLRSEHLKRHPHEFSGGQRQRIVIARALMFEPSFLVLDEPVSALDVSIQAQIINLLNEIQRDMGLAYLFIAHDLSVVNHVADQVAVMYLGRIVEKGTRGEVFEDPQHPYTQALLSAVPTSEPDHRHSKPRITLEGDLPSPFAIPSGCAFRSRCWKAVEICETRTPELLNIGAGSHTGACHLIPNTSSQRSTDSLERSV